MRVLLVEDDELLHRVLASALEDDGLEPLLAVNGWEAIEELETSGTGFGAVITDVRLGDGPSGWDVARRARQLIPTMPIIYLTGYPMGTWASEGVPQSMVLRKPFALGQLTTAVSTLMNH